MGDGLDWTTTLVPTLPQKTLNWSLAPGFWGTMAQVALTGWIMSSFTSYLGTPAYRKDRLLLKLAIWTAVIGNLFATCIGVATVSWWHLGRERNAEAWHYIPLYGKLCVLARTFVSTPVQLFFSYRCSRLLRRSLAQWICIISFWTAIGMAAICGILATVFSCRLDMQSFVVAALFTCFYTAFTAVIDIAITAGLFALLHKQVLGHNAATDQVLLRIARLALLASLPTALLAVVATSLEIGLTVRSVGPSFQLHTDFGPGWPRWWDVSRAFIIPLAGVYALALLYSLDARNSFRLDLRDGPRIPTLTVSSVSRVQRTATTGTAPQSSGPTGQASLPAEKTQATQVSMPVTVRSDLRSATSSATLSSTNLYEKGQVHSGEVVIV